jgi:hypothetical protein
MMVKPIKKIETTACMGILDTDDRLAWIYNSDDDRCIAFGLEEFLKRVVVAKIS